MLMEKRHRAAVAAGHGQANMDSAVACAAAAAAAAASPASLNKCAFALTTNTKCGEVAVPMSKFCMKHILSDTNQVLFRPCAVTTTSDDGACETPVPDLFESTTCVFHTQMQPSVYEEKEAEIADAKPKTEAVTEDQGAIPLTASS